MPPLPHQVIAQRLDAFFDDAVRSRYFKRMEFAGPAGDPGWFGPDSAVWHVHSHMPALFLGLTAAAFIENLHPSIAWMAYDHSRLHLTFDPLREFQQATARVAAVPAVPAIPAIDVAGASGPVPAASRAPELV